MRSEKFRPYPVKRRQKSFFRHIRFLPPRFEHQSPVGEGEADLSKPDPHGAGHDVGCRVENDRLEDKCFCIGEQTKVSKKHIAKAAEAMVQWITCSLVARASWV